MHGDHDTSFEDVLYPAGTPSAFDFDANAPTFDLGGQTSRRPKPSAGSGVGVEPQRVLENLTRIERDLKTIRGSIERLWHESTGGRPMHEDPTVFALQSPRPVSRDRFTDPDDDAPTSADSTARVNSHLFSAVPVDQ